mmetsp:Transcript_83125/g.248015  ORF Transcript_83125/g.248015 Transcript_83125/m.248015 type:complete len:114 (+) Transcript_83125:290-631(+)
MAAAAAAAKESDPAHGFPGCPSCARDYQQTCPKAWVESPRGICGAPDAYRGPCAPIAYLRSMPDEQKVWFETRCMACWPCSQGQRGQGGAGSHAANGAISPSTGRIGASLPLP